MKNGKRSTFLIIVLGLTLLGSLVQANGYLPLLNKPIGLIMFLDAILMFVGVALTWFLKKTGVYLTITSFVLGLIIIFGSSAFNVSAIVGIVNIVLFYLATKPILSKA